MKRDKAQYGEHRRMAAMSLVRCSRFTAILAAIAISGTAGTFWWAIEIRADLKSGASNRPADRALPSKPAARALHPKDERSNKFELMGGANDRSLVPLLGVRTAISLPSARRHPWCR